MPVDLSVIIVNYNVKAFLQQCLNAVFEAAKKINTEVFVVDNNSVDDSVEMLQQNFSDVKLITNSQNNGFAVACNQAIRQSSGKYILLLNPDTVVEENSFEQCFRFMESTPDAGALGVKMIDGSGKFLPESKRSLPNAQSAFFKMFGLSALFPNSKLFGKYQLRYLDENQIHEVEVLSGAYMFIRKSVLDEIGLLDEKFFMYGEDIDLSYRILQAGFKNYYFPETTIIHYKGESTKKASLKYVIVFYNAMLIFANKHYKGPRQFIFRILVNLAIYLRASISMLKRVASELLLPFFDFFFIYIGYRIIVPVWEYYRFSGYRAYSDDLFYLFLPSYILLWQISIYYFTKYSFKTSFRRLLLAIVFGTVAILTIYSLLPESSRYSRALILIGALLTFIQTIVNRLFVRLLKNKGKGFKVSTKKRALFIDNNENKEGLLYPESLSLQYEICKQLDLSPNELNNSDILNQLLETIQVYKIEVLIFFSKNLSASDIISIMLLTGGKKLEFKIVLPESDSMLGPKSVIDLQQINQFKINLITKPVNQAKKRILDVSVALLFMVFFPVFLFKNRPVVFFKTIWTVIIGAASWVTYFKTKEMHTKDLPIIKKGVFTIPVEGDFNDEKINELNLQYAKNYQIIKDIITIFKALKKSFKLQYPINN